MSSYLQQLDTLSKNDASIAGGKGASLGEMINAKLPVPPGFVVLASTFSTFLKDKDLTQEIHARLDEIDYQSIGSINNASKIIRDRILKEDIPNEIATEILKEFKKLKSPFVAVRSSATAEDAADASWAGELETYLNTKEELLIQNVQRCWASLFTPRAIAYRKEKNLETTSIAVAVVIQKMVQSEVSGICFTVHPVTEDPNQMIIEAGFGLGEAIVAGHITPDSYVLEKSTKTMLDINVATQETQIAQKPDGSTSTLPVRKALQSQQKLTGKRILELAEICLSIEAHYGFPVDIEWALENGTFYMTQSRPITTLNNPTPTNK